VETNTVAAPAAAPSGRSARAVAPRHGVGWVVGRHPPRPALPAPGVTGGCPTWPRGSSRATRRARHPPGAGSCPWWWWQPPLVPDAKRETARCGAGGDVTGEDGRSGYPGVVPNRGGRVRGTGEPRDDCPPTASLGDPSSPEADPERVVAVHGRDDEPPRVSGRSRIGDQRARDRTARRRSGIATGRGVAPCAAESARPAHAGTCTRPGHRHRLIPADRSATTPDRPGRAGEPHRGPGHCRTRTAPRAG